MRYRSINFLAILVTFFLSTSCSNVANVAEVDLPAGSAARSDEIRQAEDLIKKMPDGPAGYRALGMAYIRLSRETGDPSYNQKALTVIDKGLEVQPGDQLLKKLKATVLLADHGFAAAREIGQSLEQELPKDPFVMGILTDANAELGDYQEAAKYAQKMVDLRPDSQSYARAAHIRSLFGDHKGAVEMYILAARTADPADVEAQAWCLAQLGNEYWKNGKYPESLRAYDESLQIFPEYHHALFGKGRTLASSGDLPGAKATLGRAQQKAPMIDTVLLLGDVYQKLGESEAASRQYAMAEAGEEKLGPHYDEHRMALLWADQNRNLDRALEVALADYAQIKDIYASDILAWCYYRNGRFAEAREQISLAMRLNTRDARIRYHAGMIELALGNKSAAKKHLSESLSINPVFDLMKSESAREELAKL